jgi:thymidylate synthase (FAD)
MINEVRFASDVTVELVKHSASDQDILFAARVSTQGERSLESSKGFSMEEVEKSHGLINYLMRDRHGSPFEHSVFTFYVKAPIFVWREHMRHRMASYNEESGRYRQLEPEFYLPPVDRKLVQTGKAGAYTFTDGTSEQYAVMAQGFRKSCQESYDTYIDLIDAGVAREVARGVLPVTIYSSAYVTMNARALMNFLSLRQNVEGQKFPSFPQREIEMVAEQYEAIFKELMPNTYRAFVENGRVAP